MFGFLQRSVLGPVSLNTFINNLEKSINSTITHFGNGTIIFSCRKDES